MRIEKYSCDICGKPQNKSTELHMFEFAKDDLCASCKHKFTKFWMAAKLRLEEVWIESHKLKNTNRSYDNLILDRIAPAKSPCKEQTKQGEQNGASNNK